MAKHNKTTSDDFMRLLNEEEKDSSSLWTPGAQTQSQPNRNLSQSETTDKLRTNTVQTTYKVPTNTVQTTDKLRTDNQVEVAKLRTQRRTNIRTNTVQTTDKLRTNVPFSKLTGLQRRITLFIFDSCIQIGEKITNPISMAHMCAASETTENSAETTIRRLIAKGVLRRADSKEGRGGWTKYELSEIIYSEILQSETTDKLRTNTVQTTDKLRAQHRTERHTNVSSSSSVFINKNITTTDAAWDHIDLGPSENIGLSRYYITRARELYPMLDPAGIQNLIYRFEKHLLIADNRKGIRNPGAFFLSLAEKLSKGEMPLPEYKTSDDEVIEKIRTAARAREERSRAVIQEIQKSVFEVWWNESPPDTKSSLVPDGVVKGEVYKNAVRAKWAVEIWPSTSEALSITKALGEPSAAL